MPFTRPPLASRTDAGFTAWSALARSTSAHGAAHAQYRPRRGMTECCIHQLEQPRQRQPELLRQASPGSAPSTACLANLNRPSCIYISHLAR